MNIDEAKRVIASFCGFSIKNIFEGRRYCSIKNCDFGLNLLKDKIQFYFYSNADLSQNDVYGPWIHDKLDAYSRENGNCFQGFVFRNTSNRSEAKREGHIADFSLDLRWSDWNNLPDEERSRVKNLFENLKRFQVELQGVWNHGRDVSQYNQTHRIEVDDYINNRRRNRNNMPILGEEIIMNNTQFQSNVKSLLESNFQVILTGAPGTGKTFMARKVAEELVCEGIANDNETEKGDAKRERIRSVQFHPGYDYSDFVIGMKPVLVSGEGKEVFRAEDGNLYTTDNGKKDGNRTVFSGKTDVSFQWKSGVFKDFANTAKGDLDHNYVFIIDEINRADLSRVFGEMFSRLEEDYRYCRDGGNAAGVLLPNGENFVIPKNLYIIGTMNDIDRSVESMDFALRRRFAWYEVAADESKAIIDAKVADQESREKLKNAMDALNEKIASADFRLGSEYQLGGAIFAKYAKYIDDDDNNGGDAFDKLWKRHIEIILKEYLRGRRTKEGDLNDLKSIYYGKVRQSSLAAGSAATNSSEAPSSTGADD